MKILSFFSWKTYCDMTPSGQAWTLIARFSNNDAKNWMEDSGEWWYDKTVGVGDISNTSVNADMLSPAFWLVRGRQFKITRSDDPHHTALLQTTGDCLNGKTFRAKITSYGKFRNGRVWASDDCQGDSIYMFNMVASFKQPVDLDKLHAMDLFKRQHKLASGAIGDVVMEQC